MGALDAALRVNASLDEVAAALAAPDADALLAAETGLAAALAGLDLSVPASAADRAHVRDLVLRARATLARCQVLGSALSDAARLSLAAQGHSSDYGRSGAEAPAAAARGQRLRARL